MIFHKKLGLIVCSLMLFLSSGCSVFMAANQPDKKDVSLFAMGTPRSLLIAEYGQPTLTQNRDGKKYDLYKFVQGYSTGVKVGRAAFHGVADVFTLGLWEVVGTPAEAVFDGNQMAFEVRYDDYDRVDQVNVLKKETNPILTPGS